MACTEADILIHSTNSAIPFHSTNSAKQVRHVQTPIQRPKPIILELRFTNHMATKATIPPTTAPTMTGMFSTAAKARLAVGAAALTMLLPGAIVDWPGAMTVVCIKVLEAPITPGGMTTVLMATMVVVIVAMTLGEDIGVAVEIVVTVIVGNGFVEIALLCVGAIEVATIVKTLLLAEESTTGSKGETVTVVRVPLGETVITLAKPTPVVPDGVMTGGRIG